MCKKIPNIISGSRIILSAMLLLLAPLSTKFLVIYFFCGISDMLDGFIARKMKLESLFGARLDSVADLFFVMVCLIKLSPVFVFPLWIWVWIIVIAIVKFVNIGIGFVRLHRFVSEHTIANKVSGFVLFLLPFLLSIVNIKYLVVPVCVLAMLAAIQEGILMVRINNDLVECA